MTAAFVFFAVAFGEDAIPCWRKRAGGGGAAGGYSAISAVDKAAAAAAAMSPAERAAARETRGKALGTARWS